MEFADLIAICTPSTKAPWAYYIMGIALASAGLAFIVAEVREHIREKRWRQAKWDATMKSIGIEDDGDGEKRR